MCCGYWTIKYGLQFLAMTEIVLTMIGHNYELYWNLMHVTDTDYVIGGDLYAVGLLTIISICKMIWLHDDTKCTRRLN